MTDFPGIPNANRRKPTLDSLPAPEKPAREPKADNISGAHSQLWAIAGRWSPAGIFAALLLAFFILGEDRIIRVARAFSAQEELLSEVRALRDELKIEREQRALIEARTHASEKNLSALCDFVSAMNGGRPNANWCSDDGRAIATTTVQSPPPVLRTDVAWIYAR